MTSNYFGVFNTVTDPLSVGTTKGILSPNEHKFVERMYGCDGAQHACWVGEVSYDQEGKVTFAEELSVEKIGPCDGTCFGKVSTDSFFSDVRLAP